MHSFVLWLNYNQMKGFYQKLPKMFHRIRVDGKDNRCSLSDLSTTNFSM
jgi:hypothetical protein